MRTDATTAMLVDLIFGEPPNAAHPTVWMGKWIAGGRARRRSRTSISSLAEGILLVSAGAAVAALAASSLSNWIESSPMLRSGTMRALALKPALSLRPLISAARSVQFALEDGDLGRARALLSRHLVSRNTARLREEEVAGAAIESVAENLSDSVVAPLLAYRAGGHAGAYAYRFINTADAMLGYRTRELEWFGKGAARADDVANIVPARVAAALICIAACSANGSTSDAIRCAVRDARNTASPNAGWPMAAMAGALDVRLTKRGQYELNAHGFAPVPGDIARCCRVALAVSAIAAAVVDLS